jgi:RNA 2',3'-cyclic 3'-phosphodiesterase
MRLFIGIGLPLSVAKALAKSATILVPPSQAVRVRWTPPANMHITLSFLGQVHEARREAIEQALDTIRAPRMRVELYGIGTFERVGVLFAEVNHTPALLALAEEVIATMETCGFPREKRPYSPHVTLARSRDRLRLRSISPDDPVFHQSFETTEFRLYQSLTLPGGAQYEVLRSFPLI